MIKRPHKRSLKPRTQRALPIISSSLFFYFLIILYFSPAIYLFSFFNNYFKAINSSIRVWNSWSLPLYPSALLFLILFPCFSLIWLLICCFLKFLNEEQESPGSILGLGSAETNRFEFGFGLLKFMISRIGLYGSICCAWRVPYNFSVFLVNYVCICNWKHLRSKVWIFLLSDCDCSDFIGVWKILACVEELVVGVLWVLACVRVKWFEL